jgi:hypothetical protein
VADGADSPTRGATEGSDEAARPRKKYWHKSLFKTLLTTTGKLGGCYFSLVLFSKSALRLILKINACAFRKQPPNFPQLLNYK